MSDSRGADRVEAETATLALPGPKQTVNNLSNGSREDQNLTRRRFTNQS